MTSASSFESWLRITQRRTDHIGRCARIVVLTMHARPYKAYMHEIRQRLQRGTITPEKADELREWVEELRVAWEGAPGDDIDTAMWELCGHGRRKRTYLGVE
jgi:hypothetical protein